MSFVIKNNELISGMIFSVSAFYAVSKLHSNILLKKEFFS